MHFISWKTSHASDKSVDHEEFGCGVSCLIKLVYDSLSKFLDGGLEDADWMDQANRGKNNMYELLKTLELTMMIGIDITPTPSGHY